MRDKFQLYHYYQPARFPLLSFAAACLRCDPEPPRMIDSPASKLNGPFLARALL